MRNAFTGYLQMNEKEMLASINPNMRLTKGFLRSMYCKGMDNPDFPEQAIAALEAAGCSKAREQFQAWEQLYEAEREETLKRVAYWYAEVTKRDYERWVRESRRQQKTEQQIQNLTRDELTELCQKLLKEGVITEPEQFATAVGLDR